MVQQEEVMMTGERTYDAAYNRIIGNRDRVLSGKVNCIPFKLPRLQKFVPGLEPKTYTIITASSGVGKSKLAKLLYVIRAYEYVRDNPDCGIKLKIFYFCLEEYREIFMQSLIIHRLYSLYNKRVDIKVLNSMQPENVLDEETVEQIRDLKEYFDEMERNCLVIYDRLKSPEKIYHALKSYAEANGKWENDVYVPNDPEELIVPIFDHISLLQPSKGESLHEAINRFSSNFLVDLRNTYGMSPIVVQQQSSDKEKQVYTTSGSSVESKLEPSLDGLADNKKTQRDADMVLGLFAPNRYEIPQHRGYNIRKMQDFYRSVSVLKNRYGASNLRVGTFFDGCVGDFVELPNVSDEVQMSRVFNLIETLNE